MEDLEEVRRFGYYILRKDRMGMLESGGKNYKVTIIDFDGRYALLKIQHCSYKCSHYADAITTMDGIVVKHRESSKLIGTYVHSLYGFILP